MNDWTVTKARTTENGYRVELARGHDEEGRPGEVRPFEWPTGTAVLEGVDIETPEAVARALVLDALAQIERESAPAEDVPVLADEHVDLIAPGTDASVATAAPRRGR